MWRSDRRRVCTLLGDSLWYVWAEAMMRDLPSDVETFARDMVAGYRLGRTLSLPQQCGSLPSLYRAVVQDVQYIRDFDSASGLRGGAYVVLCNELLTLEELCSCLSALGTLPQDAGWLGFDANADITECGDDFLRDYRVDHSS